MLSVSDCLQIAQEPCRKLLMLPQIIRNILSINCLTWQKSWSHGHHVHVLTPIAYLYTVHFFRRLIMPQRYEKSLLNGSVSICHLTIHLRCILKGQSKNLLRQYTYQKQQAPFWVWMSKNSHASLGIRRCLWSWILGECALASTTSEFQPYIDDKQLSDLRTY